MNTNGVINCTAIEPAVFSLHSIFVWYDRYVWYEMDVFFLVVVFSCSVHFWYSKDVWEKLSGMRFPKACFLHLSFPFFFCFNIYVRFIRQYFISDNDKRVCQFWAQLQLCDLVAFPTELKMQNTFNNIPGTRHKSSFFHIKCETMQCSAFCFLPYLSSSFLCFNFKALGFLVCFVNGGIWSLVWHHIFHSKCCYL